MKYNIQRRLKALKSWGLCSGTKVEQTQLKHATATKVESTLKLGPLQRHES